jgi:histidinol phosphatase-like enzyme (inositol monophosphatase family)
MTDVDHALMEQAVGFARAAGELTLGWFNHAELTVDSKGDGTPVTQADRASERMLREMIAAAYPDDGILGEEEAEKIGTSGRRWVIDPIDGTKAFTHGVGTFSNLLYLEDEHGPAIGIINLPALGETVYAGRGLGCYVDGVRCTVSERTELEGAYLSCTGFHMWTTAMYERVNAAGVQLRTWGDAYGYALVATGRIEAMMDPILAWWDIAALTVIVPEAGGVLTLADGSPELVTDQDGNYSAVASNGALHDRFVELLAP